MRLPLCNSCHGARHYFYIPGGGDRSQPDMGRKALADSTAATAAPAVIDPAAAAAIDPVATAAGIRLGRRSRREYFLSNSLLRWN
jgi:hypothetical protein